MVILISGTTHTGKTALAQRLMEKLQIPYLSLDHLKMGLIRSGQIPLSPCDDEQLTPQIWRIVREMIKTAIENGQNLIVEGCYIPFDWQKDFDAKYLREIKFFCLIMTENYLESNFTDVIKFENVIEKRKCTADVDKIRLTDENKRNLQICQKHGLKYLLIDEAYDASKLCETITSNL